MGPDFQDPTVDVSRDLYAELHDLNCRYSKDGSQHQAPDRYAPDRYDYIYSGRHQM